LSTFREHDCPSTGSAIDYCDTLHNADMGDIPGVILISFNATIAFTH